MKNLILTLIITAAGSLACMAAAPDDNVVIESLTDTYTVIERDGKPYEVKNTEKSVYTALNHDDEAGAVAAYGRFNHHREGLGTRLKTHLPSVDR